MRTARVTLVLLCAAHCCRAQEVPEMEARAQLRPVVEIEEEVYSYEPADNGADPMWCYGSTCLVRIGDGVFVSGLETLKAAKPLLRDLVVKPDVMLANLNKTKGLIMSEKMMFVLGEKIGKHKAHHRVREIAMEAFEKDITLKEALLMHPDVTQHLSQEELDDVLDPTSYTGLSAQAVDRTIEQLNNLRQTDQL